MKIIKRLSEMIEEELDGAEDYIKCALKNKDGYPSLSKTLYDISMDEMRHVGILHDQVVKIIQEYRKEHGEPPVAMQAVYDYVHERNINHAAKIKAMQSQYRETME